MKKLILCVFVFICVMLSCGYSDIVEFVMNQWEKQGMPQAIEACYMQQGNSLYIVTDNGTVYSAYMEYTDIGVGSVYGFKQSDMSIDRLHKEFECRKCVNKRCATNE